MESSDTSASQSPPEPSQKIELFVRALFDFDPTHEIFLPKKGLAFHCGDILHVTNASDEEWWQARLIGDDNLEHEQGIIPSVKRVEKKERTRRKHINFTGATRSQPRHRARSKSPISKSPDITAHSPISAGVLFRKFPFVKRHTTTKFSQNDLNGHLKEQPVPTYQPVQQKRIDYHRPVVILGPLKDRLRDDLISKGADSFERCTNPTDIFSIRQIARTSSKHCIVDPILENTVSELTHQDLYPVTIFIKASGTEQLREWNKRWSQDFAQKQYQEFEKMRLACANYLTATIEGLTPEEIYQKVRKVIENQSEETEVWVPSQKHI